MSDASKPITIDVVSDVVCPWCYVGKRRLDAARALRPDQPVEVRWRPFQLDPTIPPEGIDRHDYMSRKFGPEKIAQIHAHLETIGAEVGIAFNFAAIKRSPNTLDAHRVIRWAQGTDQQSALKEALLSAYFTKGQDIGDRDLLCDIASAHGLDRAVIAKALADGTDAAAVQEEIATAVRMGVSGVPFFILAGRFAVSGAQASEALAAAIDKAASAEDIGVA